MSEANGGQGEVPEQVHSHLLRRHPTDAISRDCEARCG
jgi:hypothetical protein